MVSVWRVSILFRTESVNIRPKSLAKLSGFGLTSLVIAAALSTSTFAAGPLQVAPSEPDDSHVDREAPPSDAPIEHDSAAEAGESLAFEETQDSPYKEGYLELSWTEIPEATEYEVLDGEGSRYYRGSFNQTFISGLSDGEHEFEVTAYDADGNEIARSAQPAEIVVEHWPLYQAFISFGAGLVVFVSVIAVVIHGAIRAKSTKERE